MDSPISGLRKEARRARLQHCIKTSTRGRKASTSTLVWMQLPADYRMGLSYEGAVRSTSPLHPIHGVDDHIGNYFDPGNRVYAMTLQAIWPSLLQVDYNDRKLGHICEAWLACGMRSRSLAEAIEGVAGVVYVIAMMNNIYSLKDLDELSNEYKLD